MVNLWLWKLWKRLLHFFFGTTEIYRICDEQVKLDHVILNTGTDHRHIEMCPSAPIAVSTVYQIDQSLLYSSKLNLERRQLESKDAEYDEITELICHQKAFPHWGGAAPTFVAMQQCHYDPLPSPQARVLRLCIGVIGASHKLTHDLNGRAATKYDSSNKSHERKLIELWDFSMPNERLSNRVSDQWTKIGFQGTDPATDFRGMGLLGLDDLHYYAKNHPSSYQRVLRTSKHETSWFSMAVVGINITSFVLTLVRTRQLQRYFYRYGPSKEMYHEFYYDVAYVFDCFEKDWASHATPLTVMDFGRVFAVFQNKIEKQLMDDEIVLLKTIPLLVKKKE